MHACIMVWCCILWLNSRRIRRVMCRFQKVFDHPGNTGNLGKGNDAMRKGIHACVHACPTQIT